MEIKTTVKFGKHNLTFSTGKIARQATGAVLADMEGTTVLVAVVGIQGGEDTARDFFPLRVDYQEKAFASGRIPGGYFKREGRPPERETLISRLIDRPIRPLFPDTFNNEVQIIATVLSINPDVEPDIVAIIGASAALAISGLPFNGPLAAARVGYVDGSYTLNPSQTELMLSKLDLVVAGTKDSVLMVESQAGVLTEETMLGAVMFGQRGFKPVIEAIEEFAGKAGKTKWPWQPKPLNKVLIDGLKSEYSGKITEAYAVTDKLKRREQLALIKTEAIAKFVTKDAANVAGVATKDIITDSQVATIFSNLESEIVRGRILNKQPRIDGRDLVTVRPITVETGILERTHGSALFTRGETQALVTVTLGTTKDAQTVDTATGDEKDHFLFHYNFPPYSVNEIGQVGSPKRREIGHGKLAKRGMVAVMPNINNFPYVVRVVSDITESNGSSSMASVCGSSLALMDAGVPISAPVAGIAMGLIKEHEKFSVITDILGDEDHLGDMDFKVAGTATGITALQMDIKIGGITEEIMTIALKQARDARLHILNIMNQVLSSARNETSKLAPCIEVFKVDPEKIKDIIGKGGSTIKGIIESTGAIIDIKDDGTVQVAGKDKESMMAAIKRIEDLTAEVEVGGIYEGTVSKIVDFGAFVNILPGRDGLLHISQIAHQRIINVSDVLQEGQKIKVQVLEVDRQGKIKLSKKILEFLQEQ